MWHSHLMKLVPLLRGAKAAAWVLLLEQLYEVAFQGLSLGTSPGLAIAALGALAAPLPKQGPTE